MNKSKLIYCLDGPHKGTSCTAVIKHNNVYLPLHDNPFYKIAVYFVTPRVTKLGESVAMLSHCIKRERP
jgi:hypothetical protein